MYTNSKIINSLRAWAQETSEIIDKYLELTAPFLLDTPRIEPKHQFILKHLAISCNYTSHSAVLLIANGSLWEAEMLIRSVLEGSLKYTFLCTSKSPEELDNKFDEYWEQLYDIAQIREHQKSLHLLSIIGDDTNQEWKPIRDKLLPKEELENLQQKYPKKVKQALEQKWSFSEIIQTLAKYSPDEFNTLTGLAYNYNLSSHFVHQDSFSVRLVWDRNQRDEIRKSSLELAHGGREFGDLMMMARLRAVVTFKLHNEDRTPIRKLYETERVLGQKIIDAYKSWLEVEYP